MVPQQNLKDVKCLVQYSQFSSGVLFIERVKQCFVIILYLYLKKTFFKKFVFIVKISILSTTGIQNRIVLGLISVCVMLSVCQLA